MILRSPEEYELQRISEKITNEEVYIERVNKFCLYMDWDIIIEMGLEFPLIILFHPTYNSFTLTKETIDKILDSGGVANIVPGIWWINEGKQKLILDSNIDQHFPITGTLDGKPWSGLVELVSLLK